MVAAHPILMKVEDKLHDVTLAHQLDKLKMEQLLQVDIERHHHVEMYVISYFNIYRCM